MKSFHNWAIFRSNWSIPIMWIITKWLRLGTRYQIWKLKRIIRKFEREMLEAGAPLRKYDKIRKDVLSSPIFMEEDDE